MSVNGQEQLADNRWRLFGGDILAFSAVICVLLPFGSVVLSIEVQVSLSLDDSRG